MHDIITSSEVAHYNEPMEFPWMVDGARVPKNAAQLLTDLVWIFFFLIEFFIEDFPNSA